MVVKRAVRLTSSMSRGNAGLGGERKDRRVRSVMSTDGVSMKLDIAVIESAMSSVAPCRGMKPMGRRRLRSCTAKAGPAAADHAIARQQNAAPFAAPFVASFPACGRGGRDETFAAWAVSVSSAHERSAC